jgi:lipopolysaccharide export system permease protein
MSVSWANLSGPWTCHILKYNPRAMTGENVLIYALTPEVHYQIEAERIFWDPEAEQWMIERGRWREFDPKTSRQLLSYGDTRITLRPAPFTEPPGELFSLEQPPETKTARTLRRDLAHAEARGLHAAPYAMGYHLKYAQPAMPFVMIWLAIPFAMRLRRGGLAIGFGAAIALALSYQLVFFVASGLGFMGAIDPVWAAWLPNGLALALGVTLFSRIPT